MDRWRGGRRLARHPDRPRRAAQVAQRLPGNRAPGDVDHRQRGDQQRAAVPQRRGGPGAGAETAAGPGRHAGRLLPVPLDRTHRSLCRSRVVRFRENRQLALRPVTSCDARERAGGERTRQEPGRVEDDDLHRRRDHRRPFRRDPGGLPERVGAFDVAVPGDHHPVRGADRGRSRQ